MKIIPYKMCKHHSGFSLAEVLAALIIVSMVLVAVLTIYSRAERSAATITHRLDRSRLPRELLQRIAEDLDGIIVAGKDTKITIPNNKNKFDHLYQTARLEILKTIYDSKNSQQKFEEIIWQANYDYDTDANGLVLYRSHTGMASEDKLLDEPRESWEKTYSFVPICTGITFFKIQVPRGENFLDQWTSATLPNAITLTISFAEPVETSAGIWEVPDEEKVTRTIAIDRSRKIKFVIEKKKDEEETAAADKSI